MRSDRWISGFIALLLLGAGAWWWNATEWYDEVTPLPLRGEAASNRWYAVQRLAGGLGVRAQQHEQFDALPPAQATLLIASSHWALFPDRAAQLRRWVEDGGHLVLTSELVPFDDKGKPLPDVAAGTAAPQPTTTADDPLRWLPVRRAFDPNDSAAATHLRGQRARGDSTALCRPYAESPALPGAYGTPRRYAVCNHAGMYFKVSGPRVWSLDGPAGPFAVTVPAGRGRVTAIAGTEVFGNRGLLDGDHGLVAAAALDLRTGRTLWLVTDEKRAPLLAWLWQHAQLALPLALLALALALWRAGLRFGPLVAALPATRRAVTEQVRGTAAFLARQGGTALRAAQQRALHEAAAARLPGYAALDRDGRARLIAGHTGLDAAALAAAIGNGAGTRALAAELQLLEIARRRLADGATSPSSHPEPRHADRR